MNYLEKIETEISVQATSTLPVSLAQVKTHLRLPSDLDDEDSILTTYIETAEHLVENVTGIKLREVTLIDKYGYRYKKLKSLNRFFYSSSSLYYPSYYNFIFDVHPVTSIEEITYYDTNDELQTLDPSLYNLREVNRTYIIEFRNTDNLLLSTEETRFFNFLIEYKAGAQNPVANQIILLLVGLWYKNRELFGSYPSSRSDTVVLNSLFSSITN